MSCCIIILLLLCCNGFGHNSINDRRDCRDSCGGARSSVFGCEIPETPEVREVPVAAPVPVSPELVYEEAVKERVYTGRLG